MVRVITVRAGEIFQPPHLEPQITGRTVAPTLRVIGIVTAVLALTVIWVAPVFAADPGITSAQAKEILTELKKIRQLLEKNAAAPQPGAASPAAPVPDKVSVAIRDSNALGRDDAPLTLIEFADFQCPFCRRFHTDTFDEIKKNFVDTGKLRYVSRDLPLSMHDHAPEAASAARCAGEQHQFWQLRHLLILNQEKLGRGDLLGYAQQLDLDLPAFTACLDQKRYEALVKQDQADADEIGVGGTPTFIIGRTLQTGRFQGVKIVGAQSYSVFEARIRELLAEPALAARGRSRSSINHPQP
jgi:protein-disulfide isomerase